MAVVFKSKNSKNLPIGAPTKAVKDKYAQHLDSVPIVGTVNAEKIVDMQSGKYQQQIKSEVHTINNGVVIAEKDLIRMTVEGGSTINLGNYESARIGVTIQVPTTKEGLEEAYDWATTWISEKIEKTVKEAKGV